MGIRAKLSAYVATVVVMVVLGSGAVYIISEQQNLKRELKQQQIQTMQLLVQVTEESLYQNDLVLFNYFERLRATRGFLWACFVNKSGVIEIHSDPKQIGLKFKPPSSKSVLEYTEPINLASQAVGTVHLALNQNQLDYFLHESMRTSLGRMLPVFIVSLAIGLIGAVWVATTWVRPIQRIVRGMKNVANGNLTPIAFPARQDELGWLAEEINRTILKLNELDEMKADFVSKVTHELRSPLAAAQTFISVLKKKATQRRAADEVDMLVTIQNNTTRLQKMIDNLLEVAKLESGEAKLNISSFDMRDLVRDIHTFYSPLSVEKGLNLVVDVPKSPVIIEGDYEKLNQVLTNLVSNAIKYTEKGDVYIEVDERTSDVTTVRVSDTGPGFQEDEIATLFNKFIQGSNQPSHQKGTGLGLVIAKGLVEAHGGEIEVQNHPSGGAQFSVKIPKERNQKQA